MSTLARFTPCSDPRDRGCKAWVAWPGFICDWCREYALAQDKMLDSAERKVMLRASPSREKERDHHMTIANLVTATMTREQCLAVLSDPGTPELVLRGAVAALLGGTPVAAAAAPVATPAGAKAPKARQVAAGAPAAPAVAAAGGAPTPEAAIAALAPDGFSKGDLAALTGLDAKASALNTAIKNALAAKTIHAAGERRFMRYGATAAIAKACSQAAQKGDK